MSELRAVEAPKVAGFVDRGYNHDRKRKRMEEEEKEIARLEAMARGEEVEEEESSSESTETAAVQAEGSSQQEEANTQAEAQEDDSNLNAEEKSFKKRYGDLRRHVQQKEKEWEEKFEALEARMKGEKGIKLPTSDEDIESWASQYPDVAGIVETIAAKKAQEMFSKAESRLQELDEAKYEAERAKAENAIRNAHSDFDDLRASDEFHDWAESQPKWVRDALYENADDAASVIRVIDLYKVDNGLTTRDKKNARKAAASSVGKGSKSKVDVESTNGQIRESDVAKMSNKEFEENEEAINQAIRSGKFVYDLSGSAR